MKQLPFEAARQPAGQQSRVDRPRDLRGDGHRDLHRHAENVFDIRSRQRAAFFCNEDHAGRTDRCLDSASEREKARPQDQQRMFCVGGESTDEFRATRGRAGADPTPVDDDGARIRSQQGGERRRA